MSASVHWRASILEQRMAWAVAICCMVTVAVAAIKPEWFTFTAPNRHAELRQAAAPQASHVTAHHQRSLRREQRTAEKAVASARKKMHSVTPPVRNTARSKPVSTSKQTATPAATSVVSGYYAQLGAFQERARARGMADQLKHRGWHAVIATTQGGLHAVWVGPKTTRGQAETLLKSIQRKTRHKGFIVHRP